MPSGTEPWQLEVTSKPEHKLESVDKTLNFGEIFYGTVLERISIVKKDPNNLEEEKQDGWLQNSSPTSAVVARTEEQSL
jgi:hypothetical protein